MLLSKFLLSFHDAETKALYEAKNKRFYARTTILLLILIILVAGACASMSLLSDDPIFENPMVVTIVNGAMAIIVAFLVGVIRSGNWAKRLICPILTIYIHVLFNEWQGMEEESVGVLWARTSLGTAAFYFVLVIFNEAWLINLAVFTPCLAFSIYRTTESIGADLDLPLVALLGVFHLFAYGVVGYQTERLSKLAFLGQESSE